ncbi:MAG: hypothetical protein M3347_01945 [Armatimonadota bacterium]|nr:hypothetical protein [Armatimonadota bacterium]
MKVKSSLIAALLFGSLGTAALADVPAPPVQPEPLVAGVVTPKYGGPRVADIAPEFTFPDLNGKLWSLKEQRGKNAVLLILVGESPVLIGHNATPESVVADVATTAEQLRQSGVATVVVSQAVGVAVTGLNKQFDALVLKDEQSLLHTLFTPSPTALTIVVIDRAGFLRRIETVKEPGSIGAQMRRIGDPTPKLEVGQPAPDFSISDMNGLVHRLADLRGQKNLLLTFFPKCFTGG